MITANLWFGMPLEAYKQERIFPDMARRLVKIEGVDMGPPLRALVNHGRWVVHCECGGAEFTWEEGLFMCRNCFNGEHKHRWRSSVFPKARAQIETVLMARPLDKRNWYLNETIAVLKHENDEHKGGLL